MWIRQYTTFFNHLINMLAVDNTRNRCMAIRNSPSLMVIIIVVIYWYIWKERNSKTFKDKYNSFDVCLYYIIYDVIIWTCLSTYEEHLQPPNDDASLPEPCRLHWGLRERSSSWSWIGQRSCQIGTWMRGLKIFLFFFNLEIWIGQIKDRSLRHAQSHSYIQDDQAPLVLVRQCWREGILSKVLIVEFC